MCFKHSSIGNQSSLSKADYYDLLSRYAASHYRRKADDTVVHWLDENLDPDTGEWLSRSILEKWGWKLEKGGRERGKDYNHSSFCGLVITGLVGLRPSEGEQVTVNPLVPENWNYFSLQDIPYRGKRITIWFDKDGSRYEAGAGLYVYADGDCLAFASEVGKLEFAIPAIF